MQVEKWQVEGALRLSHVDLKYVPDSAAQKHLAFSISLQSSTSEMQVGIIVAAMWTFAGTMMGIFERDRVGEIHFVVKGIEQRTR